jgi:hypothetical protein
MALLDLEDIAVVSDKDENGGGGKRMGNVRVWYVVPVDKYQIN